MSNNIKLTYLQTLRGIAAIIVCAFHFQKSFNTPKIEFGKILFGEGHVGVLIFFVISGFIMVLTTKNLRKNAIVESKNFLLKRIVRIVPLYYFLSICWMIIGGTFFYYFTPDIFPRVYKSFLFLPLEDLRPILVVGWTLNYEMFFYLVFGLAILFKKNRYLLFIIFFMVLLILGFIFKPETPYLKMITGFPNFYFLIGVIFGLWFEKIKISKTRSIFIAIFCSFMFLLNFYNIIEGYQYIFVPSLVFGFLLLDKAGIQANKFFVSLGDWSYSIYLLHPFVYLYFKRFSPANIYEAIILFILEIGIVIVMSKFSYEIFEKRVTNLLRKKLAI